MNEVNMSFEDGFEIIDNLIKQVIIKGTIITKNDKEKAILLDSLNLMKCNIDNEKRYHEVSEMQKSLGMEEIKPLSR